MDTKLQLDVDLIGRYDTTGPRYTSYPTALQFNETFGEVDYARAISDSNEGRKPRKLSLYFHLPFCGTVCYYCALNKVITKDRGKAGPYLQRLFKEIVYQSELLESGRVVEQLHWGGGTPTFISHQEMIELMQVTRASFTLRNDDEGEYSVEVDPREAPPETISVLRRIGFNRLSMGVQDFDEKVQRAVNRIQSEKCTLETLSAARQEGFKSINIDLIYGLPYQTVSSFRKTIYKVLDADPDRLSVFNYAHMPTLFKTQRRIHEPALPSPDEKLEILHMVSEELHAAGYVYIGMDHFAKPGDELSIAQREGTLSRNFQGYSTHAECDLIGFGMSSISQVGNTYSQNVKTLVEYYNRIDNERLAVQKGIVLNRDDVIRRAVIHQLMCHFKISYSSVNLELGIDFQAYFQEEIDLLRSMQEDGLLEITDNAIQVQPVGRMLIRNICMVFDRYTGESSGTKRFSRVI